MPVFAVYDLSPGAVGGGVPGGERLCAEDAGGRAGGVPAVLLCKPDVSGRGSGGDRPVCGGRTDERDQVVGGAAGDAPGAAPDSGAGGGAGGTGAPARVDEDDGESRGRVVSRGCCGPGKTPSGSTDCDGAPQRPRPARDRRRGRLSEYFRGYLRRRPGKRLRRGRRGRPGAGAGGVRLGRPHPPLRGAAGQNAGHPPA